MASGSSIGDGYGPMVVAARPFEADDLVGKKIAVPGKLTSAYLALKLFQPDFEAVVTPFDKILDAVRDHSPWKPASMLSMSADADSYDRGKGSIG